MKTTLEDLRSAQVSLEKELNGVQEKRTNALLKLAKGDRNMRQLLDGFDTMEREVKQNLAAHKLLLAEAEAQAAVAQAEQEAANRQRQTELEAEFNEQEARECEALCAGFEERKKRMITKWLAFSKEYADLQVVNARLQNHPATNGKAGLLDLAFRLRIHLTDAPRLNGLRPLFNTGHKGSLTAWPCIDPSGLCVPEGVPGSPLNVNDVVQAMKTKRWNEFQQKGVKK